MRKHGGGFGIVILLVVLAVVMLLVARNWKSVAPTAIQVTNPSSPVQVDDHGQPEAGEAIRSGQLPNLNDMRQATSQHASEVQDALQEIE